MIALKVRARKLGTDAMLAFASPPWQSYLLSDEERVERSHMVSQIVPRLYLTNCRNVQNEATLKEYGVTHVLSVIETPPRLPRHMKLKTLHVPVTDYYSSPLLEHLDKTTEFIKSALEENDTNVVFVRVFFGTYDYVGLTLLTLRHLFILGPLSSGNIPLSNRRRRVH